MVHYVSGAAVGIVIDTLAWRVCELAFRRRLVARLGEGTHGLNEIVRVCTESMTERRDTWLEGDAIAIARGRQRRRAGT